MVDYNELPNDIQNEFDQLMNKWEEQTEEAIDQNAWANAVEAVLENEVTIDGTTYDNLWSAKVSQAVNNNTYAENLANRFGMTADSIATDDEWESAVQRAVQTNSWSDALQNNLNAWAQQIAGDDGEIPQNMEQEFRNTFVSAITDTNVQQLPE